MGQGVIAELPAALRATGWSQDKPSNILVWKPRGWDLQESCDVLLASQETLFETAPPLAYFFISKMGIMILRPWRSYWKKTIAVQQMKLVQQIGKVLLVPTKIWML